MASTILRNARLIDGTGRVWDRADIHVEGEWIRTVEAEEGTLEPGKKANLVVLGEDPLADVKAVGKVLGVMKYGVWAKQLELGRAAVAV